jgi:hypothetical protein
MAEPFDRTFTAQELCRIFWLDRRILEQAIHNDQLSVPPVKQGAVRRFNFWEGIAVGIFAELLRHRLYRAHAAKIAAWFDFSSIQDQADDKQDQWLLIAPSDNPGLAGADDERFGFYVNATWAKRSSAEVCLPKIERQLPGERKAGRRRYFRHSVVALNVSDLVRELERHAAAENPLTPDNEVGDD